MRIVGIYLIRYNTLLKLQDKRVLVTGGAGFIGSETVNQLLTQGSLVTVFDNFSSGKMHYLPKKHPLESLSRNRRN